MASLLNGSLFTRLLVLALFWFFIGWVLGRIKRACYPRSVTEPKNVNVHCLICWTVFVTSEDSYEKGEAVCPAEGCGSTAVQLKGAEDDE